MTKEEVAHLVARTKDLIAYQQTPDRVEDIQKVPCLKREDINKNDTSKWMKEQDGWLLLPQQTNAIYYGKLMFTLKDLTEEELPYAAILARTLGKLDTRQYSYEALATEIDLYTGGVYGKTAVFSTAEGYEPFLLLQGTGAGAQWRNALRAVAGNFTAYRFYPNRTFGKDFTGMEGRMGAVL